ncbi:MAG TPA: radical SAM protein [Nitrospirae bacterium]|nr:(Dimethylallyl)adenosine tRNA methylthiotransferase MiaB [bacterium BMS3Abin10]GBE39157.1 (Dimethylallyl)adenosine tRNA methylthiotransferase MiaB [bacterium BMS3Bbin08]HDH50673.1 radical SAM protein [Nitrospirota bacterium]HDO26237.1 radical SAM protein [Nitrospirota bacterium]HDZ84770.1 radical SAM protein [Nitrospirota bacterium]
MKKKVLLITPPYHSGVVEAAGTWLNLGFVYIAGSLRKAGYAPEIYDAMSYFHEYEEIQKKIEQSKPDVVAVTAITATIYESLKVLEIAKKINPEIVTVIGGIHPTFCGEEIFKGNSSIVDYIVRGEGEVTLPELLDCHFAKSDISKVKGISYQRNGRSVVTAQRNFIEDLDSLHTAWDLVDWKIYSYRPRKDSTLAIISSSRGCNQQCSFCSQQLFWERKWRARSPENFVAELEHLHKVYGVNVAMIPDENPTYDRTRWEKILNMLIEKDLGIDLLMETRVEDILRDRDIFYKYKKAGIVHIYVGVESVSQKTLVMFNKSVKVEESKLAIELINQHDIVSETSFVLGIPDETKESINTTLELAKHYNPDMAFFLAIAPWPYADIYKELKPYIAVKDYSKYNLVEPVVKPVNMSIEELSRELLRATKLFYMDKLEKLDKMSPYKKEFMLSVMKLLMEHSYLAKEIEGVIPPEVKKHIDNLKSLSPIP